jgi:hypothetical protein
MKKSLFLETSPCFYASYCNSLSISGRAAVTQMGFLDNYLRSARTYRCSLNESQYCSLQGLNTVFGTDGKYALEGIALRLVFSKCLLPI